MWATKLLLKNNYIILLARLSTEAIDNVLYTSQVHVHIVCLKPSTCVRCPLLTISLVKEKSCWLHNKDKCNPFFIIWPILTEARETKNKLSILQNFGPLRPRPFCFAMGRHSHICSGFVSCRLLSLSQNIQNCFLSVIVRNDRWEFCRIDEYTDN